MYDASLDALSEEFAAAAVPRPVITAGLLLNRAIMDRLCLASKAYVDYLLQKVHNSHVEERRRIGRELHDRAATSVVVGLQSLDLHEVYLDDDAELAAAKLAAGPACAGRGPAGDPAPLGGVPGDRRHGRAAARAGELPGPRPARDPDARSSPAATSKSLPGPYAEEVFLVLREAARNALTHANPSTVSIELRMQAAGCGAACATTATGFDPQQHASRRLGIGLVSMRERVALLGGSLDLLSKPHRGTSVEVSVPLSRGPR